MSLQDVLIAIDNKDGEKISAILGKSAFSLTDVDTMISRALKAGSPSLANDFWLMRARYFISQKDIKFFDALPEDMMSACLQEFIAYTFITHNHKMREYFLGKDKDHKALKELLTQDLSVLAKSDETTLTDVLKLGITIDMPAALCLAIALSNHRMVACIAKTGTILPNAEIEFNGDVSIITTLIGTYVRPADVLNIHFPHTISHIIDTGKSADLDTVLLPGVHVTTRDIVKAMEASEWNMAQRLIDQYARILASCSPYKN